MPNNCRIPTELVSAQQTDDKQSPFKKLPILRFARRQSALHVSLPEITKHRCLVVSQ